jgi:6-phosphogluconate dehydrogenase
LGACNRFAIERKNDMELGMIGLGRMGTNMARRQALPMGAVRFGSRGEAGFADKVLSALRYEFGGHEEKAAAKEGGA